MSKSVRCILLLVVLIFSCTYASADTMSRYGKWLDTYDFESMLADIESGKSGLSVKCISDIEDTISFCRDILEECNYETDSFTGEVQITHKLLKSYAVGCQVYPFIDRNGLNLFVGFPYSKAMHYDHVYLNFDGVIFEYSRSSKDYSFEIKFDKFNGKKWEYSILGNLPVDYFSPDSVSFREDGSVIKVDYVLTDNETIAVNALVFVYKSTQEIRERIATFDRTGF